jgi:hypothetical protein
MREQSCPTVVQPPRACTAEKIVSESKSSAMPPWVHSIALRHWHAVPVYFQLATQLRELHEHGVIVSGEHFPQLHLLASWVGIGKKTVRSAVAVLEGDRLLHRHGDEFRFA